MKQLFTATNGHATAHRFPSQDEAFAALRARPFTTRERTQQSQGIPNKYCRVIAVQSTTAEGKTFKSYQLETIK